MFILKNKTKTKKANKEITEPNVTPEPGKKEQNKMGRREGGEEINLQISVICARLLVTLQKCIYKRGQSPLLDISSPPSPKPHSVTLQAFPIIHHPSPPKGL
ncbi:hypothetical protein GDO86_018593 [Hymenochirus boettgeri]|uniref:Uncharacterized protein n=1 Tax=Hymenochirus boettgeri TaxID=247094 RepID=A0A8T2I8T8_9PIPI|nr:hypothetical protein GDO86_018593 [Hymenochirus boettgeri]